MFAYAAQTEIKDLGTPLELEITQFAGAQDLYTPEDPVFPFPLFAIPIVPGSVEATMSESGATVNVEVVEVISTEGELSPRRAEVDYQRGLLRFEAPPLDAEETIITAQWQIALKSKRLDTLARLTLDNIGILDRIGITPTSLRGFSIDKTPIIAQSNIFSSHGRPFVQSIGIARWMVPGADGIFFAIDNALVEYDEQLDEYEVLAEVPADTSIDEVPPGSYGTALEDESVTLQAVSGFTLRRTGLARTSNRIYVFGRQSGGRNYIMSFNLNGEEQSNERRTIRATNFGPDGLTIFEGRAYVADRANSGSTRYVDVYNLATGAEDTGRSFTFTQPDNRSVGGIAVTPTRIYVTIPTNLVAVRVFEHDGTELTGSGNLGSSDGIAVDNDYIYLERGGNLRVYDFDWNRVESAEFDGTLGAGLSITPTRLYTIRTPDTTIYAFSAVRSLTYEQAVAIQFDTHDFDSFYILGTNTSRGDVLRDTTFNRNIIYKYVRSTDTWTTLLDVDTGQPQIAHAYDFVDSIEYLTDNRKTFQVVRRNSKTFIFYRRATATEASITYYNETDDVITNIHTETYTGINDNGTPYSMDFFLDERS